MERYDDFKNKAVNSLEEYLNSLLENGDEKSLKKVKLMSYWMKEYCEYLHDEEIFKPEKLKRYERGDIIKVNLGYNVGSEEGGLHYAVVWDINNSLYTSVITVIPLTSVKKDNYIPRKQEVLLGNDVYKKVISKFKLIQEKCVKELEEASEKYLDLKDQLFNLRGEYELILQQYNNAPSKNAKSKLRRKYIQHKKDLMQRAEELQRLEVRIAYGDKDMALLEKIKNEMQKMKKGSIALVGQVTTISKMRIYDPKNSYNVLSGIKLSAHNLDNINEKFKELYVYK